MCRTGRNVNVSRWRALFSVAVLIAVTSCGDSRDTPSAKKGGVDPDVSVAKPEDIATPAAPSDAAEHVAGQANRLVDETSPYLLMHAHNPVQWYPWGEEAFAKARREGKLIFLSIGYSSCYWCHVMERESFMSPAVAKLLNEKFVAIKVDREERPDVDEIYMSALQISGRSGGWPLSMFLTADAKPFFGGTYIREHDFLTLLKEIDQVWQAEPERIRNDADSLTRLLQLVMRRSSPAGEQAEVLLEPKLLGNVDRALAESFDPEWGGFGFDLRNPRRPKFPVPSRLMFLLRRAPVDDRARNMLLTTLDKMTQGGIWDHVGGGFHRYSTDRYWHIPHFEKMLYDNGQLATVYAEAFALTDNEEYRLVLESLLAFVQREMTGPDGEFYSAIDAETDAEEGKFYRWTKPGLESLLTTDEQALMSKFLGFSDTPNFEGLYYVPLRDRTLAEIAKQRGTSIEQVDGELAPIREKLLAKRDERERPLTDTKVITAWNGLMIRGFADAGRVLNKDQYKQAAARAADFVLAKLQTEDGRLLRTYRKEQAKLNGYIDDYAFLVDGIIALHRATGDEKWLRAADALTAKQIELFWDDERGGFFFTSHDHESLIARAKSPSDSVRPSGNSVAADNLIYLGKTLNKPEYIRRARETIAAFAPYLADEDYAVERSRMAVALDSLLAIDGDPASAAGGSDAGGADKD